MMLLTSNGITCGHYDVGGLGQSEDVGDMEPCMEERGESRSTGWR